MSTSNEAISTELEVQRVVEAARDALTDEMVGRLTEAVGEGLSLLDQVNRSGLEKALPSIARMVRDGDLERLVQLARVYGSAEDALSDEMIGRLAETLAEGLSLMDRLSRGGDRQLNRALHTVILHRRQHDPATRDYIARRLAEGKSARDATRILKRYLARHLYRVMQNATPLTT